MTRMTRSGLLVGMHFRPPAKWVLARLRATTPLIVEPEPENEHDPHAIRVLVATRDLPDASWFDSSFAEELIGCGLTPEELKGVEVVWLGYLAREGNKQLQKLRDAGSHLSSASTILDLIKDKSHDARLAFGLDGSPQVEVSVAE